LFGLGLLDQRGIDVDLRQVVDNDRHLLAFTMHACIVKSNALHSSTGVVCTFSILEGILEEGGLATAQKPAHHRHRLQDKKKKTHE
jgi:hypothetical protein